MLYRKEDLSRIVLFSMNAFRLLWWTGHENKYLCLQHTSIACSEFNWFVLIAFKLGNRVALFSINILQNRMGSVRNLWITFNLYDPIKEVSGLIYRRIALILHSDWSLPRTLESIFQKSCKITQFDFIRCLLVCDIKYFLHFIYMTLVYCVLKIVHFVHNYSQKFATRA